jgi:hypothetical protein
VHFRHPSGAANTRCCLVENRCGRSGSCPTPRGSVFHPSPKTPASPPPRSAGFADPTRRSLHPPTRPRMREEPGRCPAHDDREPLVNILAKSSIFLGSERRGPANRRTCDLLDFGESRQVSGRHVSNGRPNRLQRNPFFLLSSQMICTLTRRMDTSFPDAIGQHLRRAIISPLVRRESRDIRPLWVNPNCCGAPSYSQGSTRPSQYLT